MGTAFANALANQSEGHTNLLAVLTPNLLAKPATMLITKVTIKGMKQAVQMFGPAQYAVAKAVADSVADGTIPASAADELVIICGVFIHPHAEDNAKILKFNYEATKLSIARAMKNQPSASRNHRAERHGQAPVRRLRRTRSFGYVGRIANPSLAGRDSGRSPDCQSVLHPIGPWLSGTAERLTPRRLLRVSLEFSFVV